MRTRRFLQTFIFPLRTELVTFIHAINALEGDLDYKKFVPGSIIDDETLTEFVKKRYGKSFLRQLDYVVTMGFKDQDDFIQNGLLKIYR